MGLGCSNSERIDNEVIAFWDIEEDATPLSTELNYLPIDDSAYPYAGIPRIVIETENNKPIEDRETEIPAKMQIWGKDEPESEVMELAIRGRGNTSWTDMPKKSYKIEFINKQSMLGMPKDRDWALIANYADKTLMKNYLMYHLSAKLGAYYAPRCEFAELYLNNEYLGVYLLTETIKIGKNRINIPKTDDSFIVEVDAKYRPDEQVIFSDILKTSGKYFRIHNPQSASSTTLDIAHKKIEHFESFLKSIDTQKDNVLDSWIDTKEYILHYWVQEFSKNPDATFGSSVYFYWTDQNALIMGPVWDFDLSLGNYNRISINQTENWIIKGSYWNKYIFKDSIMQRKTNLFWNINKEKFDQLKENIDSIQVILQKAALNNFKKWNILRSTNYKYHNTSYQSYNEATDSLKAWITERINWINSQTTE